ncbi:MAG: aminodeoxychorismate synthase component I [Deltaproteobacteria bacterium]|nr:aminodeoxychorismate synthase component I [Deltaproteobacteria bacterium]MBW2384359.1 aminodeoxychorismate synthase component I [Deltaproteobacteria bacterium]MBW2696786.1 aminodeoxychorismate synthase component I [Deltaproteobacteria bacterium]
MSPSPLDHPERACEVRWRALPSGAGDLLDVFERIRDEACPWLLDSALVDGRLGRFSFAGADPHLVLRAFGRQLELHTRRAVWPGTSPGIRAVEGDVFQVLRRLLQTTPAVAGDLPIPLPFIGGAVGYLGYELAEETLPVELNGRDDLGFPDATLLFVDRMVALDHEAGTLWAIGLGFGTDAAIAATRAEESVDACARWVLPAGVECESREPIRPSDLEMPRPEGAIAHPVGLEQELGRVRYENAVSRLRDEIAAGNVYEANLTQRMTAPFAGDTWTLYRALRQQNPAPFASFMDLPDGAILSSSPERFLQLRADGRVESRPIKGTRPRGATPDADRALAAELVSSEKDRAENLMIVDLVRNDLGRVCEIGSVEVPAMMEVERYASVFQLVSTVVGRLADGHDGLDLVRAAFPPGSMTGAPKIAAVRLLDTLEPVRRGVYSGAIGYLDVRGGLDLSVVIRTLLVRKGRAHLHVGGAVVADSDPAAEYEESLDKARALLVALRTCTQPPD